MYIACPDNVKNGKYFLECDSFTVKEAIYTDICTVCNPFKILTAIKSYRFMPPHSQQFNTNATDSPVCWTRDKNLTL